MKKNNLFFIIKNTLIITGFIAIFGFLFYKSYISYVEEIKNKEKNISKEVIIEGKSFIIIGYSQNKNCYILDNGTFADEEIIEILLKNE